MNIEDQLKKIFRENVLPIFKQNAMEGFAKAKKYILDEVSKHDICQELRSKEAPSKFLASESSTLFGFMGFESDFDPVGHLLTFLEKTIQPKFSVNFGAYTLISSLSLPTKNKMREDENLRMPWLKGMSWPEAIEVGVSGLKYFIGKEGKGRSELGIQATKAGIKGNSKQIVRNADMEGVEFLSKIFSEAKQIG